MANREWPSKWTERGRSSAKILPRPTKRQHTAPDVSHPNPDTPLAIPLSMHPASLVDGVQRRHSNHNGYPRPSIDESNGPLRGSDRSRHPFTSSQLHEFSNRLSSPSLSSKPFCRVCRKCTNVKYDPIITCPRCHRQYHDSCRKPPLIAGIDPQHWRCSSCLGEGLKHTSLAPSVSRAFSTSTCASQVERQSHGLQVIKNANVDRPTSTLHKPSNASIILAESHQARKDDEHEFLIAISSAHEASDGVSSLDGSGDNKSKLAGLFHNSTHVEKKKTSAPYSGDTTTGVPTNRGRNAGKYGFTNCSSTSSASDLFVIEAEERIEISNTPTQRSSPFEITKAIPKVHDGVTEDVCGPDDSSNFIDPPRSEKSASVYMLRSVCRKQHVLAKKKTESVICHKYQKRLLITKRGSLIIPETSNAVSPVRERVQKDPPTSLPSAAASKLGLAFESVSTPWYESSLVSSKPKISVGAPGNKKFYGFASADVQARDENDYPKYCTSEFPLTRPTERQLGTAEMGNTFGTAVRAREGNESQISKEKKSASTLHTLKSTKPRPHLEVVTEQSWSKLLIEQEKSKDSTLKPFERSKLRQPLRMLEFDLGIKREANFQDVHVQNPQGNIEKMSNADKVRKVDEIKARSSRKKYFGSDHRLAHKRRFGLQDIHDERDGAWTPQNTTMDENQPGPQENLDMNDEGSRTIREAFDLPRNMIPMNDGKTELAFRDGALVNGRLPRPRNVYKVGKMFGGELTIRTS